MIKITRDSSPEELTNYWQEVLQYRMADLHEVSRLKTAGLGFYCRHKNFELLEERHQDHKNFLDFIEDDKRPFGNKCIPSSIIFNLGWDVQRTMCFISAPDWVKDEAQKLYKLLIREVEDQLKDENLNKDAVWTI